MAKMSLAEHDDVIKTLPPDRADEPSPIDRAELHKAEAHPVPPKDRRGACKCPVGAGIGMSDPDLVEPGDPRHDRGLAVIYIVGEAGRLYGD